MSINLVYPPPMLLLKVRGWRDRERWGTEEVKIVGKKEWGLLGRVDVYLFWRKDGRREIRKMDSFFKADI